MSLLPPSPRPRLVPAGSEFAEVGIYPGAEFLAPKCLLEIVLGSREAIAIDLSQTKWKYPSLVAAGYSRCRGENRG